MIKIERVKEPPQNYEEFLFKNPYNLIYATSEFIQFLNKILVGEPYYLIAKENSHVIGSFIYFKADNSKYGVIINSLPWYGSYGGCILQDKKDNKIRKLLIKNYLEEISRKNVISSTLILSPFENEFLEEYIKILKPQYTDLRIGQVTILPAKGKDLENRLMMTFKQKTRNLVRKALKQKFTLVISDENWAWDFLYKTHLENMLAIGGKAKPKEHFEALRFIIPNNWRELFIAIKDDKPVAALLLCYFNKTVEYITPVIKYEFRSQQPLSFLIWHAMLRAIEKGYKWWNWGGTWISQKSLHHFKAGWGAIDIPYNYLINVSEEGMLKIKSNIQLLIEAFPYYYIFPFNQLHGVKKND